MRRVHKYKLAEQTEVRVGTTAKVVHFARQRDEMFVWIDDFVDAYTNLTLTLRVVGTGHEFPEHLDHMGSLVDGPWVWHLYGSRSVKKEG